ncbi:MAG: EAL domain-containing protein [Lachnospiraceae bacterium]|nr:EAL domain-containing protein [Lachnospiraceae bacterium]
MSNTKTKGFRKYNKNNVVSVTMTMLFLGIFIAVFLVLFVMFFFRYVVASGIISEYGSVLYMGQVYDAAEGDLDKAYNALDAEGRSYFIRDEDGKILHEKGKNTCASEGEYVTVYSYDDQVYMYADTDVDFIRPEKGSITFDYKGFVTWARFSNKINRIEHKEQDSFDLPVWVKAGLSDGNELIGQVHFHLENNDIIFFVVFCVCVGALTCIAFVLLLIHMFRSVYRKHKLTDIFYMDDVTDGRNWMWFTIKGEQILKKKKNASINYAILDLVFVKYRNYCVVHSVSEGEQMLRRVENFVNTNLYVGEMIAHYASANFAVMMRYTNETELYDRIDRIMAGLEHLDKNHKFSFHVGVDLLGITKDQHGRAVPRRYINIEREYNNACAARATLEENDDSARATFDSAMVEEQKWIDTVRENQQSALDNEEFLVYYQPKYDPQTNELKGAEALIRWQSPVYGFKGPGAFIPIFEKNGFITEIDHYMLRHVAMDQKRWLEQGYSCVPVSVNISRAHFIEDDLAEQIRDAVDAIGTPHELIELELTESAFFDDKNALVTTIKRLKSYGFTVSMDDFGSGYSSLNSLKDIPLDVLKLDAEFFRGDADDKRREIIVAEAIKLAKCLNMRTVAEGVEVKEQVDFLADQGCDMIQGYYFAKPLPGNEYEDRIRQEK